MPSGKVTALVATLAVCVSLWLFMYTPGTSQELKTTTADGITTRNIEEGTAVALLPPSSVSVKGDVEKKNCAVVLFGRVRSRRKSSQAFAKTKDPGEMLRRVRDELEAFVVQPNEDVYNITVVFRVEHPSDEPFVRQHFGRGNTMRTLVITTVPQELTIGEKTSPDCPGFRMWSNVEMGIRRVRELEKEWWPGENSGGGRGAGGGGGTRRFEWVLLIRADIHVIAPFDLERLNPALLYVANVCIASRDRQKEFYRTIPCLPNETMHIRTINWPQNAAVPAMYAPGACTHRLTCKPFDPFNASSEGVILRGLPEYYLLGNSTTMDVLFSHMVEDWHGGVFGKSAAHCNHGVLEGRVNQLKDRIQLGRYLYQSLDLQIPRHVSWYPKPSLIAYLRRRGAAWPLGDPPQYDLRAPRHGSVCPPAVCANRDSDIFING